MNCTFLSFLLTSFTLSYSNAGKVSSTVKVQLPKDLVRAAGYDHREALFGIPPYGGSIEENVIYAEMDMCTPYSNSHWKPPFILLIDRGGCTFVQKVRNAQHAGAAAVVIADNTCLCSQDHVCTPEPNTECEKHEPIMADDGSGFDVTIPSVLMFKQDADPIKEASTKKKTVRMELKWSVPTPDDHVEWELWTSPTDYVSSHFKTDFKSAVAALGEKASFTPRMYIYDGIVAHCRNDEGESECANMCTNKGRYCASDPDNEIDYGISGGDVVTESLRRLCIWELYGGDGVGLEWWDYQQKFTVTCDNSADFMKEECVKSVMSVNNIDYDMVDECMFDHGGIELPGKNDLLQTQLDQKEMNGIVIMPVAYVNGVAVRGFFEYATIFKAICAGYESGTEPDICVKCASCPDEQKCVEDGGRCTYDTPPPGTVKQSTMVASLAMTIMLLTAIGVGCYLRQQAIMKEQVRGILKEYMPLDIQNQNGGGVVSAVDDDEEDNFQDKGTFT